jgi:hypothetical protein
MPRYAGGSNLAMVLSAMKDELYGGGGGEGGGVEKRG